MATNPSEPMWDKDSEHPTTLRQPNSVLNQSDKKEPTPVIWNTDAPEFIPGSYFKTPLVAATTTTSSSVQSRLKVHKNTPQSHTERRQDLQQNYNGDLESPDIIRLKQIINTLTNDPGQFDNLLDLFLDTLVPYYENILTLSCAAHLLVAQAIDNQNFRYTGARLCFHIEQYCPKFRAELHLTCNKELATNPNKQNVLLFIAELYTQLYHENIYGDLVIEAFKQLLSFGGNDNIKCICQALKLTGYSLEKFNKEALDDVFNQLVAVKATVNGSALILVNSVLALREQQWGHSSSNEANNSNDDDGYYYEDPQSTIFYNADGQAFTSEENEFLAANMNSNDEYLTDTSDPDELCDPEPEMDEEIQAAFKEFVKLSKR